MLLNRIWPIKQRYVILSSQQQTEASGYLFGEDVLLISTFAKRISAFLVIIIVACWSLLITYLPDAIMINYSALKQEGWLSWLLPKSIAKARLRLEKFASCELDTFSDSIPIAHYLVNVATEPGADRPFLETLFEKAVAEGCSLNSLDPVSGLRPIHSAVMWNDPALVELLMRKGANQYAQIQRPGKSFDGMNAIEMAQSYAQRFPHEKRDEVVSRLGTVTSNFRPLP